MFKKIGDLKVDKNSRTKEMVQNKLLLADKICCTVKDFAVYMDISYDKANQLTRAEGFPIIKIGSTKLVVLHLVKQWLEMHIGEEF